MPWWGSNTPKEVKEIDESVIIEDITITATALGRGSYGSVFAAVYEGKPCVAKEMHPHLSDSDKQNYPTGFSPRDIFIKEINTLYKLKHPSIVQFLGVYFKEESFVPILVMERLWINVSTLLHKRRNQVPLFAKARILHDVACGLQYLHNQKKPVIHRDINANNILLNELLEAKIVDLGQAKALENFTGEKLTAAPGNLAHMPPETLKDKPIYDTKLDVFSFGCTIIHLVTEKFPKPTEQFVESEESNSYIKVSEYKRREEYFDLMNSNILLRRIAKDCLEDVPTNRPTALFICGELEKYIEELETKSQKLAEQHKQDKLSLIHLLHTQESQSEKLEKDIKELSTAKMQCDSTILKLKEELSQLKSHLHESNSRLEENEKSLLKYKEENQSLQKKVADQDETNKKLTISHNNQIDRLKEDLRARQDEMQKEIDNLKNSLEDKESMFSQEKQKNDDLQNIIQKMKDKEDNFIQEKDQLTEENKELKLKIKKSEEDYSTLQCKLEEQSKYNEAFVAEQRKTFTEKLKKREDELKELTEEVGVCKEYKSKYIDLQQEYTHLMQKYAALQEDLKKAQVEKTQQGKKVTDAGSKLHKQLLELQSVKEKEYQELKQQRQYYNNTFREKDAKVSAMQVQLLGLRQRAATQKQQLEEKSYRLSTLESSLNEFQELSYSKEEKLKSLEEEVAILKKALENNEKIQKNFEKVLKSKEESLERKEKELQLQKKEHADEINTLHNQHKRIVIDLQKDIEIYKSQMISEKETHSLKMEKVQCDVNLEKNAKDKFKNLENELKNYTKTEKILKRQIKQKDADVKEKTKHIESLEKNSFIASPDGCNFDFHWYPYLSFPAKRITPSITIVQEKVYVTSGYQSTSPQGQELESYFKCSEVGNEVFCFNTGICRCDTITSPVKLGALASVNGQCVLVSGADSVGNTLTGNVYVLCEEGSHDQWKEFSKPLPTPRILACACCYDKQWLIVCGGFTFRPKEESNLFEAVSIVEILDTTKGEWYTLSEENCPNFSTILCCTVVGEDVYVVGSDQVIKTSCNNLIKAATSNNTLVWDNVQIETEESNEKLYPFSVVEVNGEPMIIASMTDGEDDVTCVLMKDTRGRWRIMSKAVECQHCSAAVITSSLELLLFGGSEKISVREATDISQKSTLTSTLDISSGIPMNEVKSLTLASAQSSSASSDLVSVTPNQPANVFFTGPIHTAQFDHNGGTFQSPIHKVSLVVPPNALSDGEKVTVYMGATTSGPFDLPEDCKLRSAVVWLSISPSDVVFKKNLMLLVPHSAIFTSPKHHCMMRFVICEDRNGIRYKFSYSSNEFEIDEEQGLIELSKLGMVAIIANPGFAHEENEGVGSQDSDKNIQDAFEDVECLDTFNGIGTNLKKLQVPLARYLAKLFWPRGELPSSFKTDIYYLQCLPTELYKVNQLYRKVYYEENGAYPEIVETEFMISGHGANLQCILPCNNSSKCDCLTGWDVTPLTDLNVYVEKNEIQHKVEPMKFSFKFSCLQPDATCNLTCCFEFHGVENIRSSAINRLPLCLQERSHPFILEKGIHCGKTKVSPIEGQAVLHSDEVKMAQSDEARSYQATDII